MLLLLDAAGNGAALGDSQLALTLLVAADRPAERLLLPAAAPESARAANRTDNGGCGY